MARTVTDRGEVLDYLSSSGDSDKTFSIAKTFFSSSFGILSDVYIILLLGLFFTASPAIYKNGIIRLLPSRAKEKGAALLEKLHRILKGWIKGKILGFFFIAVLTGTVDHPDAARADTGPCGRPAKFHPKLWPDYRAGAGFFARAATGKLDSFHCHWDVHSHTSGIKRSHPALDPKINDSCPVWLIVRKPAFYWFTELYFA